MKNSIKRTLVTLLTLALVVACIAPVTADAKTDYYTKKEITADYKAAMKEIKEYGDFAGSENYYMVTLYTEAMKLVPSITNNESYAYVGDAGKINVTWKNMTNNTNSKCYKGIKWSSSNTKIAKVTQSGKVTFKKAGKVTITAKSITSGKSSKLKVTVMKADW
jgi:uncharacterized protein YjdB